MNEVEAAWLAGLIEGEGTFETTNKHQGTRSVRIAIKMTDLDVLEKAQRLAGGTIIGPEIKARKKPAWTWRVAKSEDVLRVLVAIVPHMGQRRLARIEEAVEILYAKMGPRLCAFCEENTFYPTTSQQKYCFDCQIKKSGSTRAKIAMERRAKCPAHDPGLVCPSPQS